MALDIPNINAVGPGGRLLAALQAQNEEAKNALFNKFYGPDIQSQINNKNALTQGQTIENQFMPEKLKLANQAAQQTNQFYPSVTQANINSLNAGTNKTNTMTPLEAAKQQLENDWYDKNQQAINNEKAAQSNYYNMGGAGGGVDQKQLMGLQRQIARENPNYTPDQANEEASAYLSGKTTRADGTPLPPPSGIVGDYLDNIAKRRTTAKLATSGVQANQADAELTALTNHINPVIKDVGTTYFNKSMDQLSASFSNDPASQQKLGRIIGARSLQYAIAQLRNRIDMGEPGINATKELMDNSGQVITQMAPRITPAARQAAQDFMNEGVRKALSARNKYGVGIAGASGRSSANANSSVVRMRTPDGKIWNVPADKVDAALKRNAQRVD
jgi:hypothetical protein